MQFPIVGKVAALAHRAEVLVTAVGRMVVQVRDREDHAAAVAADHRRI
jgi:hypothetical protein